LPAAPRGRSRPTAPCQAAASAASSPSRARATRMPH
jgi:hypothetical protein